jgi:hypothetical protein
MTVLPTIGWAVCKGGRIDIRTVSETRRAAVVNWLLVGAAVPVNANCSDGEIERLWMQHHALHKASVTKVCVEVMT